MALLDLVDETFVVADPARVSQLIHDPAAWARWWPDLTLEVFEDRGSAGLRWNVTGALVGSAEFWLEEWGDGVLVHYYLRADPAGRRRLGKEAGLRALRARKVGNEIKDSLEGRRVPGSPLG